MSEACRSMIDGMMECLGEMAALLVGGRMKATAIQSGPKEANSRDPLAVVVPSPEADNEFLPPTSTGVPD